MGKYSFLLINIEQTLTQPVEWFFFHNAYYIMLFKT